MQGSNSNPAMTAICRRFLISGRVQGVFYRSSTQHKAIALGLRGWVRNLADGRVECLACGEAGELEELEKWLEIGPEYAKVTNIEVITESSVGLAETFEVLPTTSLSN
jgi:acylphosphatase